MYLLRSNSVRSLAALLFFALALPASSAVLSIGHRGDSLFAPENTISSFKSALGKADFVELDTYVSLDGVVVVMHDSTVDRTTDGTGSLTSKTLAQIKQLDAGSWFAPAFTGERVPTLEEVITNVVPQAMVLIERKGGSADAHMAELRRLGAVSNVVVQCFDWNFLAAMRALDSGIRLGALGSGAFTSTSLASILSSGASMVAWERAGITPAMVQMVHGAGLQLFVWTVDGPDIVNFIELGVDGIISNDPGMVRKLQEPPVPGNAGDLGAGLFVYWRMDDGLTNALATNVTDHKGTGSSTLSRLDGLSHWGGPQEAKFGACVNLDGANAFIPVPRNAGTEIGTNGCSYSAWIKLRELPSKMAGSYGAILDSTNDCFVIYLDKANKELRFKVTDAANHAARPGIPESQLATNIWLHVVATYAGKVGPVSGQASIYLNARPIDVHTGNDNSSPFGLTGIVKSNQFAAMGREGTTGGSYFAGSLDDVALWRRALDPAEITALYAGGQKGLSLADLLRQPTPLLKMKSLLFIPDKQQLAIEFQSFSTWPNYRLLRAESLNGPFLPVQNAAPVSLGRGFWRFSVPYSNAALTLYRVEAE